MNTTGMEGKEPQRANQTVMASTSKWRLWVFRLILALWRLQLFWLAWHFRKEFRDAASRVWHLAGGKTVRQEDPFYRWLLNLARVIPPEATYLFLDNYEAGKEIEARYHLYPRRHLLLPPQIPPSQLYHILRQNKVSYVLVRETSKPLGPGLAAALNLSTTKRLPVTGAGLVFQVHPESITGGFYD